jgi:hypothetical protein
MAYQAKPGLKRCWDATQLQLVRCLGSYALTVDSIYRSSEVPLLVRAWHGAEHASAALLTLS